MTRLLFVPNPHSLIWLELPADPRSLVEDILRGDWTPPAPYARLSGRLKAYWQDGLVIVSSLEMSSRETPSRESPAREPLSRRQREVMKGLIDGLTSRQIALRLGIQERTVYHHVAQLKALLGAASRAELIHKARDALK